MPLDALTIVPVFFRDILLVRTVYNEVIQNIGNNYLKSDTTLWFVGPDLIASVIRTGRVPRLIRAVRMVPHGKQAGMREVNLRGMVEIDPYKDDIFRKVIEQRKLHKSDEALYYWLKILANSIEKPGAWFFPPLASLITSGGRLLLAMTEACVEKKKGTYLFCGFPSNCCVEERRDASHSRQQRRQDTFVD